MQFFVKIVDSFVKWQCYIFCFPVIFTKGFHHLLLRGYGTYVIPVSM